MKACPCGSSKDYNQCCEPIHLDHSQAQTPEQLMRSRYSAHVKGLVNYVVDTYHPSCLAENERDAIAESVDSDWCGLEVISAEPSDNDNEGFVAFKAYFNQGGEQFCLQERSRFIRESGLWYYIDGTFIEQAPQEPQPDPRLTQPVQSLKVGRNDPCICGSGKKYKKCCG